MEVITKIAIYDQKTGNYNFEVILGNELAGGTKIIFSFNLYNCRSSEMSRKQANNVLLATSVLEHVKELRVNELISSEDGKSFYVSFDTNNLKYQLINSDDQFIKYYQTDMVLYDFLKHEYQNANVGSKSLKKIVK